MPLAPPAAGQRVALIERPMDAVTKPGKHAGPREEHPADVAGQRTVVEFLAAALLAPAGS
jgi:hypothetical protein